MKDTLIRSGVAGLSGALAVGFVALLPTAAASDDEAYTKRDEQASVLVTADDDDSDDDSGTTRETAFSGANSGVSRDATNSRVTPVSRDRDRSVGDLTRDWTRDGGDRTRDWTPMNTNDNSGHDTRGSAASRDATNSRETPVSRDRDLSRGDLTRDWTWDGGDRTRDWSRNSTNDASRNDTRGR